MNELISIVLGYVLVVVIAFLLFNFLSNGFLATFIRVKGSRGRLVFIRLYTLTGVKYKAGKFEKELLKFKVSRKESKAIMIDSTCITREMGVVSVAIDDVKNLALKPNLEGMESFDAEGYDNLLVNAQNLPKISQDKEKMILLILVIAILVVLLFVTYRINALDGAIKGLQTSGVIG